MTRAESGAGLSSERASTHMDESEESQRVEDASRTSPATGETTARRSARARGDARGPILLLAVSVAIELAWLVVLAYLVFRLL
jgi:hypothetical protein